MAKSSLPSKAKRSLRHLRWSKTDTGWGGDDELTLFVVKEDLLSHVEMIEGEGRRWHVWVFTEDDVVLDEDVLIDESQVLAMRVQRTTTYTKFSGAFHHYEIYCDEHPLSVLELDALL